MVNTNQIMYDVIKRSESFETTEVNEIEEVVDYGIEKNEDNIQKVALEYLDEKGFARRVDNLEKAKQIVLDSSMYSDTVCIRKRREIREDMLLEAEDDELAKLMDACVVDKLTKIDEKLAQLTEPRYEYMVEVVDDVLTEEDRPIQTGLKEFESFPAMLNRYASQGWRVCNITARETPIRKITMTGFASSVKQVVVVFERLKR